MKAQLKAARLLAPGCPVPLSDLRLLTVSHRSFRGRTRNGQLVVNKRAARPLARVFRRLYQLHFPIRHLRFDDAYGPRARSAARRRRQWLVRMSAGSPFAVHGRQGHGFVVDARLRVSPSI